MSDLVGEVMDAITNHTWHDGGELFGIEEAAESAIAAATPHIRAALFDELIAQVNSLEIGTDAIDGIIFGYTSDGLPIYSELFSTILRTIKENTQP